MPSFLVDLHHRVVLTCRRIVEAADSEEAELIGSRLVRDIDPTEFDEDPRFPPVTFCAGVVGAEDPVAESLYRRLVEDLVVLRDLPGFSDRLRSLLDGEPAVRYTEEPADR